MSNRRNQIHQVTAGASSHSTVQYSTVQYSTVQYSTVQYSTVQYSTVQWDANSSKKVVGKKCCLSFFRFAVVLLKLSNLGSGNNVAKNNRYKKYNYHTSCTQWTELYKKFGETEREGVKTQNVIVVPKESMIIRDF
jgi:hypothetical protein